MNPQPSRRAQSVLQGSRRAGLCLLLLALPPSGAPPLEGQLQGQALPSVSVVRGRVMEHGTDAPLAGAAVSLAAGPGGTDGLGTRVTDANGRFLFRRVPPGAYRLIVTLIGYRELRDTLPVGLDSDLELILPMSISPIELEPLVIVSERRTRGIMGDFEGRRRSRSGAFFDREEIEALHPSLLSDLLRSVPGARVVPTSPYDYTVRLRGGCRPGLWVDGMRLMTEEGMDDILLPMDLEAVEVYHSASLPVQFGTDSCGAIVVWTRRGEPTIAGGPAWRKFVFAGGFAFLALLLTR